MKTPDLLAEGDLPKLGSEKMTDIAVLQIADIFLAGENSLKSTVS